MDKMRLHEAFKRAGANDDEAEIVASTIVQEVEGGMSSVVDETLLVGFGLAILICSMLFLITQYFVMQHFFGQGQPLTP
jgi:hypothetical protein